MPTGGHTSSLDLTCDKQGSSLGQLELNFGEVDDVRPQLSDTELTEFQVQLTVLLKFKSNLSQCKPKPKRGPWTSQWPSCTALEHSGSNSRRGHMGLKAVMARLGVIGEVVSAPVPPRGRKRTVDEQDRSPRGTAEPQAPCQRFVDFRRACRDAQGQWDAVRAQTSIVDIGSGVRRIVDTLASSTGVVPCADGYVKKTVIRKLIFACPHAWRADDWSTMTRKDLQELAPGEVGVLKAFPEDQTADSISTLVFGRPDWGLLLSMWTCLWKPAVAVLRKAQCGSTPVRIDAEAIGRAATTLKEESGGEVTAAAVARRWLQERAD